MLMYHPEIAQSLRDLGVLLHRTDRRTEADHAFRRALEIGRAAWPATHPRLTEVPVSVGELLLDEARPQEAETLLREALAVRRSISARRTRRWPR